MTAVFQQSSYTFSHLVRIQPQLSRSFGYEQKGNCYDIFISLEMDKTALYAAISCYTVGKDGNGLKLGKKSGQCFSCFV